MVRGADEQVVHGGQEGNDAGLPGFWEDRAVYPEFISQPETRDEAVSERNDQENPYAFKLAYPVSKIRRVRQIAYNLRRQERGKARKRFIIQMALLREAGEENVCQKI